MRNYIGITFAILAAACGVEKGPNAGPGIESPSENLPAPEGLEVMVAITAETAVWDDDAGMARIVETEHEIEGVAFTLSNGGNVIDGTTTSFVKVGPGETEADFSYEEDGIQYVAYATAGIGEDVVGTSVPKGFLGTWSCTSYDRNHKAIITELNTIDSVNHALLNGIGWLVISGNTLHVTDSVGNPIDPSVSLGVAISNNEIMAHVIPSPTGYGMVHCLKQ